MKVANSIKSCFIAACVSCFASVSINTSALASDLTQQADFVEKAETIRTAVVIEAMNSLPGCTFDFSSRNAEQEFEKQWVKYYAEQLGVSATEGTELYGYLWGALDDEFQTMFAKGIIILDEENKTAKLVEGCR